MNPTAFLPLVQLATEILVARGIPWDHATATVLEPTPETIPAGPDAVDKVIQRIRGSCAEGGEGWAVCAFTPGPLRLPADLDRLRHPMSLELVQGNSSVHLRFDHDGWSFITFREVPSEEAVTFDDSLLGRDGRERLKYRVCHRLEATDTHRELRPYAARFAGFHGT